MPKGLPQPEEWKREWLGKVSPTSAKALGAGWGRGGKQPEASGGPAWSCKEEAGSTGPYFGSGKRPTSAMGSCHPQGLAQSRHTRKYASLESVDDHKVCGPMNTDHQHKRLPHFPSSLTLGGRHDACYPFHGWETEAQ